MYKGDKFPKDKVDLEPFYWDAGNQRNFVLCYYKFLDERVTFVFLCNSFDIPGEDYPIFAFPPDTSFVCDGQPAPGYYSDPEADCQSFHICANLGDGGFTKYSLLCPNGNFLLRTLFIVPCDQYPKEEKL